MNDATSLVVMMETVAALENVEEIIGTEGVDMLLIGSNDLCAEMGIAGQYDHPRLKEAFARSIAAATKAGKHVGIGGLASRDDLMTQFVRMGARYVSTGTDLAFLVVDVPRGHDSCGRYRFSGCCDPATRIELSALHDASRSGRLARPRSKENRIWLHQRDLRKSTSMRCATYGRRMIRCSE